MSGQPTVTSEWQYHGSRAICRSTINGIATGPAVGFQAPLGVTCDQEYLLKPFAPGKIAGPFPSWAAALDWLNEPEVEVDGP